MRASNAKRIARRIPLIGFGCLSCFGRCGEQTRKTTNDPAILGALFTAHFSTDPWIALD
jgi:hypothetical protein